MVVNLPVKIPPALRGHCISLVERYSLLFFLFNRIRFKLSQGKTNLMHNEVETLTALICSSVYLAFSLCWQQCDIISSVAASLQTQNLDAIRELSREFKHAFLHDNYNFFSSQLLYQRKKNVWLMGCKCTFSYSLSDLI